MVHQSKTRFDGPASGLDTARPEAARFQRLEALWRIVNTPNLRGNDLLMATLREAAAVIFPGERFVGTLAHIDGSAFVLDALSDEFGATQTATQNLFSPGQRIDVRETLQARDPRAARTQSWEDCQAVPDRPAGVKYIGIRSQITTRFIANATTYILTIGSLAAPVTTPFDAHDCAYIELLGTFLARQLEIEQLEDALGAAELRARQHAKRLEALWQIANDQSSHGEQLMFAMMREAAGAIRVEQCFRGILGRIEGPEVVVIAVGHERGDSGAQAVLPRVGSRKQLDKKLIPLASRTQGWEDVTLLPGASPQLHAIGWRAAIATQFKAGASTYSLTFISPEPAREPFGPEDVAYLDVLAAALGKQLEVDHLERSLREEEEHSRYHSERLEALWAIVNDASLGDDERLQRMLGQVAAAIRPDQPFRATLWRVDGDNVIIEAVAEPADAVGPFRTHVGRVTPATETVVGRLVADGVGTRSWDDIQTSDYASSLSHAHGTRSFIVTMFRAGSTQWGLAFASREATHKPFGPQDHAYIEVLASFFSNHVQQRWQFERIQYQQSHDVLTGLLNRSQFRSQARAAARTTSHYAVVLVGVDAFREVNQSYGNMIGDALLVEIGNALEQRTEPGELVGRVGGDIFGIFIPNAASREAAMTRARDFAGVFARPFSTGDRAGTEFIARTASLGVAGAPTDGLQLDEILARADAALVNAKRHGHGSLTLYEAGMEGDAQRRALLRTELMDAVALDQLELYYQPHIELAGGNVTGCEALVRWNHPTRGVLLPSHFIPFAEQSGMITSIDTWVMNKAFATANELGVAQPGLRVYFNLSGRQAGSAQLVRAFVDAARRGVNLANIGVEITETDAMRDVAATRRSCRALRRLNVRIAIDDFGTGYSSLSSLKQLPVDIVKIDRSFVSGLARDRHDQTITETILAITDRFGFESLAEGVETAEELDWLRAHGCRFVQGFAVCRPLPLAGFKAWLAGHDPDAA